MEDWKQGRGDVLVSKLRAQLFRDMVGVLISPSAAPFDTKEARRAILDMVNRQAVLEVLGPNAVASQFFDFQAPYQSAFPFGWNGFEPFSETEWQAVQALLPNLTFANQATEYTEKRGARTFDRRSARSANRVFQELGYSVSPEDGWLKNAEGEALSLRLYVDVPHPSFRIFDKPFFTEPLGKLGLHFKEPTVSEYLTGRFDAVMTVKSGAALPVTKNLLELFSAEEYVGTDLQVILAKITELANAYYAEKPFQSVDDILNEVDADTAEIKLLVRLFDKVLISDSYFLPIVYACNAPQKNVPCRFPN